MSRVYDKRGPVTLLTVPIAAALSAIAFTGDRTLAWIGVAVWGVVNGVLDSTVKSVITELVPANMRAIAFGWLCCTASHCSWRLDCSVPATTSLPPAPWR